MPRKKIENKNNSIYRFMCLRSVKGTNYHTDFKSKAEAISYADGLNDKTIIWYGIYEINETKQNLIPIISNRIQCK